MKTLLPLLGALALVIAGCESTNTASTADRSISINTGSQSNTRAVSIPADNNTTDHPYAVRGTDDRGTAGPAVNDVARRGTNGNY
jgi:outer membrane lipoprotein SlyB